ncbi:hypothetical protein [Phycicoccus sp. Root563]|uniref:hypothetical protein n=1 Tax=Phycicoccus sp. Root563 TaxID=1736562 RepID=UPI000AAC8B05|nr:hypothetical protein [Phycicoccus sp. Root563]
MTRGASRSAPRDVDDEQLHRLLALCAGASAGPWVLSQDPEHEAFDAIYSRSGCVLELDHHYFGGPAAELICAAPELVPALVREVLRLRSTGTERARRDREELARLQDLWAALGSDRALRQAVASLDLSPWVGGPRAGMWLGRRQLKALEALATSAPPAPWHWRYSADGVPRSLRHGAVAVADVAGIPPSPADAALIVATREHLQVLVDLVLDAHRLSRRTARPALRVLRRAASPGRSGQPGRGAEREIRRARRLIDDFSRSLNQLGDVKGPSEYRGSRPLLDRKDRRPPGM